MGGRRKGGTPRLKKARHKTPGNDGTQRRERRHTTQGTTAQNARERRHKTQGMPADDSRNAISRSFSWRFASFALPLSLDENKTTANTGNNTGSRGNGKASTGNGEALLDAATLNPVPRGPVPCRLRHPQEQHCDEALYKIGRASCRERV